MKAAYNTERPRAGDELRKYAQADKDLREKSKRRRKDLIGCTRTWCMIYAIVVGDSGNCGDYSEVTLHQKLDFMDWNKSYVPCDWVAL